MPLAVSTTSGAYQSVLAAKGLDYLIPLEEEQAVISRIIYEEIKEGKSPNTEQLLAVADGLRQRGADTVVLGCTELSLLRRHLPSEEGFTDSLEVLAASALRAVGKETVGFSAALTRYASKDFSPKT